MGNEKQKGENGMRNLEKWLEARQAGSASDILVMKIISVRLLVYGSSSKAILVFLQFWLTFDFQIHFHLIYFNFYSSYGFYY